MRFIDAMLNTLLLMILLVAAVVCGIEIVSAIREALFG